MYFSRYLFTARLLSEFLKDLWGRGLAYDLGGGCYLNCVGDDFLAFVGLVVLLKRVDKLICEDGFNVWTRERLVEITQVYHQC